MSRALDYPFKRKVFSGAFLEDGGGAQLEHGGKIIVHPSILGTYGHMLAGGAPLMFKLQRMDSSKSTHCGVLEFTASNPKHIYAPRWYGGCSLALTRPVHSVKKTVCHSRGV
jgi:hypothetical protein